NTFNEAYVMVIPLLLDMKDDMRKAWILCSESRGLTLGLESRAFVDILKAWKTTSYASTL
ncbi:unnamed protein product, partial [Rangifer tarandus platyrhynchus]